MDAEGLRQRDVVAQVEQLRSVGGALALTEASLAAIARGESRINAFITLDAAGARAMAAESDRRLAAGTARPLEGVPVAVKDNLDQAGLPTTAGMATRRERIAAHDAGAVARLRAAGAVLLGKLNLNEAVLGADTDNPHFGRCHHPQRHGYTPGGSSGGSAAAVAAGYCAATLGTDTMGSVRIPASYCGVYGLKPTRGLVSTAGSVVVSSRLDHVGPLARSARDLRLLLGVLAGYDPDCPAAQPIMLAAPRRGPLCIGVLRPRAVPLEPAVAAAFAAGLALLRGMGHALVELDCGGIEPGPLRRAGLLLAEAGMLAEHAEDWAERREQFSPALVGLLRWAESQGAAALGRAEARIDAARVCTQRWLTQCDLLVLPTTPQQAFAFGSPVPPSQADLCCFANFAGLPALSAPLPMPVGALPAGIQWLGPHGSDLQLIELAEAWAAACDAEERR
ncbi:MAG: amidase [Xanthomonadales bacterium]|jgi:aspartyl-tRNA(Asn)/glutamyl-tRNA(Gln) amidotransferase subunit A|nr:amidase [Xanthomonadales bacterium]